MSIYTPPNCTTLAASKYKQQLRLGIQGFPKTGKTWSALTFPNPIVINMDRGLAAHEGRSDVIEIPFYKTEFCGNRFEVKDKLVKWLEKEASNLTEEQTLIFDGFSSLEIAYHIWFSVNQHNFLTKQGKVDDFAEYQVKKKYFAELHEIFKSLKCDLIAITHESERADKPTPGQPSSYNGKIRPLLTGAYGDMIVKDYSDWYRQHSADKPKDFSNITPDTLFNWGCKTLEEFKLLISQFETNTVYFWQTAGDDKFDGGTSLINCPRFLPANYQSFTKYQRQNKI